jgi:hypothetical protein
MTDNGDPIGEKKDAVKKCAQCGKPTTLELRDPFDKTKDRPLCAECLARELTDQRKP